MRKILLFCLAVLLGHAANADVLYDVVDLGPGMACGISDNGYIMGVAPVDKWGNQVWRMKDGVKQYFEVDPGPWINGKVNTSGQMVGSWLADAYVNHKWDYVWKNFYYDGVELTTGTGTFLHINSQGVAVGRDYVAGGLWDSYTIFNGVRTALPSDYFDSLAINDSGAIAGLASTAMDTLCVHADGQALTIPFPQNDTGVPIDMANNGHITGVHGGKNGITMFLYDGHGFNEYLENHPYADQYGMEPRAINESDVIVANRQNDGYVFRDGAIFNLNDLINPACGWHVKEADDVNNNGQIVGIASGADGVEHAILLNPIPEPAKLAGDANGDGKVDFADYLALEDSFGGLPGTGPNADFNASGTVDFADYLILEANFGHGNNSIPEPATMGLLGLSALLVLRRKRSR